MTDPLAMLRARFLARCEEDLAILGGGGDGTQTLSVIHRLAGSAGIFGYGELGSLALRIDDHARATGQLDREGVQDLIAALQAIAINQDPVSRSRPCADP